MKRRLLLFPLLALLGLLLAAADSSVEPLPEAMSNNAVAILRVKGQLELFSMMGIGPKKTWDAVSNEAYEVDASSGKAYAIHAVPADRRAGWSHGRGSRKLCVSDGWLRSLPGRRHGGSGRWQV